MNLLKKSSSQENIPEDEVKSLQTKIQELTDKYVSNITDISKKRRRYYEDIVFMFFKYSENKNILKHLGIIMDGNRRWAKSKKLKPIERHKKGIETAKIIIKEAIKKNILFLTLYAFSSENWKRNVRN